MIELVFVACLQTQPDACRDRGLLFANTGLMTCMVHAQAELAKWMESQPREAVREWRCRSVKLCEIRI